MKWRIALFCLAAITIAAACWSVKSNADVSGVARVEYIVVPAEDLGIKRTASGGAVFNYGGVAEKLNEFAREGWRYRDLLENGNLSAVLLERTE